MQCLTFIAQWLYEDDYILLMEKETKDWMQKIWIIQDFPTLEETLCNDWKRKNGKLSGYFEKTTADYVTELNKQGEWNQITPLLQICLCGSINHFFVIIAIFVWSRFSITGELNIWFLFCQIAFFLQNIRLGRPSQYSWTLTNQSRVGGRFTRKRENKSWKTCGSDPKSPKRARMPFQGRQKR